MRVLVCGGRNFGDKQYVWKKLQEIFNSTFPSCVITGGAHGVDSFAKEWADNNCLDTEIYNADWQIHGKAACPIRNQQMLDEGKPDLVVAFPGGRGTADMVSRAKKAGIKVIEISPSTEQGEKV